MRMSSVYLPLMAATVVMQGWYFGMVFGVCLKPPVIFSFGDSNSDTGGLSAGLGYSVNPPNGRSFFGRSTGRLSDGRLILDFLCKLLLILFYYLIIKLLIISISNLVFITRSST